MLPFCQTGGFLSFFQYLHLFLMCVKKGAFLSIKTLFFHCGFEKRLYLCSVKNKKEALKSGATG